MWSWKPRGEIHKKSQSDNNVYAIYTTNAYTVKNLSVLSCHARVSTLTRAMHARGNSQL